MQSCRWVPTHCMHVAGAKGVSVCGWVGWGEGGGGACMPGFCCFFGDLGVWGWIGVVLDWGMHVHARHILELEHKEEP